MAIPDKCGECEHLGQIDLTTSMREGAVGDTTTPTQSFVCGMLGPDRAGRWAHVDPNDHPPRGCPKMKQTVVSMYRKMKEAPMRQKMSMLKHYGAQLGNDGLRKIGHKIFGADDPSQAVDIDLSND